MSGRLLKSPALQCTFHTLWAGVAEDAGIGHLDPLNALALGVLGQDSSKPLDVGQFGHLTTPFRRLSQLVAVQLSLPKNGFSGGSTLPFIPHGLGYGSSGLLSTRVEERSDAGHKS